MSRRVKRKSTVGEGMKLWRVQDKNRAIGYLLTTDRDTKPIAYVRGIEAPSLKKVAAIRNGARVRGEGTVNLRGLPLRPQGRMEYLFGMLLVPVDSRGRRIARAHMAMFTQMVQPARLVPAVKTFPDLNYERVIADLVMMEEVRKMLERRADRRERDRQRAEKRRGTARPFSGMRPRAEAA